MPSHIIVCMSVLLFGAWFLPLPPSPQNVPADLVLTNGTVITVDPKDTVAQAVAVRGGKIVFVGSSIDAKALIGERTQVIDLAGRTATPGLIDTHVHFSESADNLN